jgi:eukaryotic-like serine/threonine-protein kinase
MIDDPRCRICGEPRDDPGPDGLCPQCLKQQDVAGNPTIAAGVSVLETLAGTLDSLPCVRLRDDTGAGKEPPTQVDPGSLEGIAQPDRRERLQLFGEIARGGMGAVLRGRDADLGRDLAVKVLLVSHQEKPELVRRFVEEAQIAGQLQHPGVVPVYELGSFADRRPFFTMKLVKGRTLAELIHSRSGPADDLPRFLDIFESICQTMAYAHSRGVIHRDLKPSNIMVGSYGEVQVMDWGLAKVLPREGVSEEKRSEREVGRETVIATARSESATDVSLAGSVLGTPAYIAPEQARGDVEAVDERADVFGLGAILCEVITGQPAFVGRDVGEILRKASRGDLAEAFARLDGCGAEPDLIALARDCLAPEHLDRPRHAGLVAERITAYLSGVQERLRTTELARVEADARAQEERKRRRLAMALAAAVVALMAIGGTGAAVYIQQRRDQATRLDLALREVYRLRDQAQADSAGDPVKWHAALAAVDRAEDLLGPLIGASSRRKVLALRQEVGAAAGAADRDANLILAVYEIRAAKAKDPHGTAGDEMYGQVFRQAGIDVDAVGPEAAAAEIRARPASVIPVLAAALDDWATRRRKDRPKDAEGWRRLIATARAADPDKARNRLRDVWLQPEGKVQREPLLALAKEADPRFWPVQTITLMASSLLDADEPAAAAEFLDRVQAQYPDDVWINHILGTCLEKVQPPRTDEAIRFYTAARALRPETAHDLAHALNRRGRGDEALAVFQDLTNRQPTNGWHWGCLATLLETRGDHRGAEGALAMAVPRFRQTLQNRPDDIAAHVNLGGILCDVQHDYPAAAAEYREVLRLNPAHVVARVGLGNVLREQGQLDEAAASYREAIRLKPDFAPAHHNLAYILVRQGNVDGAIAEGRESLRLQPDSVTVPDHLAWILAVYPDRPPRDYDEAAGLVRQSLETRPKAPGVHATRALVEYRRGHWDDAIAAVERSMALRQGGQAAEWFLLAMALARKGEKEKALPWFDKAVERAVKKNLKELDVMILWSEAARLLGRPGPDAPAPAIPKTSPSDERR